MKKIIEFFTLILLASCLMTANYAVADSGGDSWVSKSAMPTARGYIGVAVVDQKIYAIGGSGPTGENEAYNTETDMWTAKAAFPDPKQSFGIAQCQGKIYCIGGLGADGSSDAVKVYDPTVDSWQNRTAMPTARYAFQANVVNGKIYCIGGVRELGYNQGVEELTVNEVYDPTTDTWATKTAMPNAVGYVSAVLENKIYVIGPQLTQIYDPETDTWSNGASPPENVSAGGANGLAASAAATTGTMAPKRIYVYDGVNLQIYDPQKDSWTKGTPPPTSRQYLGIGVVDDKLYFIGGMSFPISGLGSYYVFHAENEEYTPLSYGTTSIGSDNSSLLALLALTVTAVLILVVVFFYKKRKQQAVPNVLLSVQAQTMVPSVKSHLLTV